MALLQLSVSYVHRGWNYTSNGAYDIISLNETAKGVPERERKRIWERTSDFSSFLLYRCYTAVTSEQHRCQSVYMINSVQCVCLCSVLPLCMDPNPTISTDTSALSVTMLHVELKYTFHSSGHSVNLANAVKKKWCHVHDHMIKWANSLNMPDTKSAHRKGQGSF